MLESYGIRFNAQYLANDKKFVRSTRKSIDRYFSNNFSSHASMSSLTRNDEQMGLVIFQAGYLSVLRRFKVIGK